MSFAFCRVKPKHLIALVAAYAILIAPGLWFQFLPVETRIHEEKSYVIRRGFGFPQALIPGVELFGYAIGEHRLTLTDHSSGTRITKHYDIRDDIYEEFPYVWKDSH